MIRSLAGLILTLAFAASDPAAAQTRRALVIGIDNYRNVEKLQKAGGDARAMQAALAPLGFEVDLVIDPDRAAFNAAVSAFTGKLNAGDVALLHFSGHGVALDGDNYLLPGDAPRPDRVDKEGLKLESFALMPLIERIRATGSNVQIAIVDACRDNPYAVGGTRSIGRRGGLVEPQRSAVKGQGGFFILFSAGFGQTAADRLHDNDPEPTSVYTRTLLRKLTVEGKAITDLAREVREDVEALAASVRHEQRPAYYDELSGPPFYFAPPRAGAKDPATMRELELTFWHSIKDSPSPALLREYIDRFGGHATFASIARERLKALEPTQAPATSPVAPAPARADTPPVTPEPALTLQPSFDCRGPLSAVEQAICAQAGLATRDRLLSEAYYRLADTLPAAERLALRDGQREWMRSRNACGTDAACIARAYDLRLSQLQPVQVAGPVAAVPQRAVAPHMVSPSFSCGGKLSAVERMICAEPALAERDNALAALYRVARNRPGIVESQRNWMRSRNACTDPVCVARAYDSRIGALQGLR